MKSRTLAQAVSENVVAGDTLAVINGHTRWSAAAREVVRQFWGTEPGFTLIMPSLGTLGTLFVRGGLVRKVVTAYSGDSFPTYTPNPIFQEAYQSGRVEVEHWSFLSLIQRLEAAANGLPAAVSGSLVGSSMANNEACHRVETPLGEVTLLEPLTPDVAIVHGAVADRSGNVIVPVPLLDGLAAAWAARRGVIATVEKVVESLDEFSDRINLPAHRVLAVAETPFGAHPGGCFARGLPVESYGEDIEFWVAARHATRADFDTWIDTYVLGPTTQDDYLKLLGAERLAWLRQRSDPDSWKDDAHRHPIEVDEPISAWERAATFAARELVDTVASVGADVVLAGAGVANLAAWVGAERARLAGHEVTLVAELGLVGYHPTPADPYIFNHRVFPTATMLADATTVLGTIMAGPGTRSVACLGAAQIDGAGNINSTQLSDGRFLVGSGGGNDVASGADACVVVTLARPERLCSEVGFVTSPGRNVVAIVTDLGVLRRRGAGFELVGVAPGPGSVSERVETFRGQCGFDVMVADPVSELTAVSSEEVLALREYDRERLFLA